MPQASWPPTRIPSHIDEVSNSKLTQTESVTESVTAIITRCNDSAPCDLWPPLSQGSQATRFRPPLDRRGGASSADWLCRESGFGRVRALPSGLNVHACLVTRDTQRNHDRSRHARTVTQTCLHAPRGRPSAGPVPEPPRRHRCVTVPVKGETPETSKLKRTLS